MKEINRFLDDLNFDEIKINRKINKVNNELKQYIEGKILPEYELNDGGHNSEHVKYVLKRAFELADGYEINYDILYTCVCFHDVACHIDRDRHEVLSAERAYEDEYLNGFFSIMEMKTIRETIEDHRASLEYIVMSYIIEVEEKTYNEFLILSNNDIQLKRKFTVPNTLLKKFGKRLNKISNNLFTDTTVKQREKIMVDLYDILCKYTHASIVVSTFNEIEDKNERKVVKLILSYNLYLIKLILLDCLKFFNNDDKEYIDEKTIGLSLFLSIIKLVNLIQANNIKFDKIKQFFYYDTINSEFYTYYKEGLEKIKKEISESIVEFKGKENKINQIFEEFMKF